MLSQLTYMTAPVKPDEVSVKSFESKRERWLEDVRCKVCTSYPSVVALHAHQHHTPPIAIVGGTQYREVKADHEKHACHEAAVRAKRQHELQE